MNLIVDIRSHDEPIRRYIGNPELIPDCYSLEVSFVDISIENREH